MGDLVGKRREGRMPSAPHAPLGRQLQVERERGGPAGVEPSKLAQLFRREQPIGGLLNARANIVDDAFAQFGSKGVMHVDGNRGAFIFTSSSLHRLAGGGPRAKAAIGAKRKPASRRRSPQK